MENNDHTTAIVAVPVGSPALENLRPLYDRTEETRGRDKADNTKLIYTNAGRLFGEFCDEYAVDVEQFRSFPPAAQSEAIQNAVSMFLQWLFERGRKYSTIQTNAAGIAYVLRQRGFLFNYGRVTDILTGFRRRFADEFTSGQYERAEKRSAPITNKELLRMLDYLTAQERKALAAKAERDAIDKKHLRKLKSAGLPVPATQHVSAPLLFIRDRAILLIGRQGAFRRSELVALNIEDLSFIDDGVNIRLNETKTSGGKESFRFIESGIDRDTCPVCALRAWIAAAGITTGKLFRSVGRHGNIGRPLDGDAIRKIIIRLVTGAGIDADGFTTHSLRSGFATQARIAGISYDDIGQAGGWANEAMPKHYDRTRGTSGIRTTRKMGL